MGVVETGIDGSVMTITLNDDERRNALSSQLLGELMIAINTGEKDPHVRVIVLTNRGTTFCAGANLAERTSEPPREVGAQSVGLADLFRRIRRSPKPFVGRIAGHCVAGGVGLAAVMDISIAIDSAKFGFTEVRVGVAPAIISVVCLPKMRLADAQSAFLRGNRFSAEEAARIGLINRAVSLEEIDREIDAVVNDLLAGEPHALAVAKQLSFSDPTMSEEEAFASAGKLSALLFQSDEAREGMTAFLEKRPASWVEKLSRE